jgi:hypothetical protein
MSIPPDQLSEAVALLQEKEDRVPSHVRDKVKLCHRQEGNALLFFEFRPSYRDRDVSHEEMVAKFVYIQSTGRWKLFRQSRSMKWQRYEGLPEAADFPTLFREVERDPLCFFWG